MLTVWLCLTVPAQAANWMKRLPDDTFVAVLSIPGAHDSATGCGWAAGYELLGDNFARTQDLDIQTQWGAGVRAFDLRPCVHEDYMNLNHGIVATKVHFEDALCLLRDSLVANPSEFAIIHLLHETDGDQVENAYNERLRAVLTRDDLKDYFVDFKTDLKVNDVRGKILLLSRDNYQGTPIGGILRHWTGEVNWTKQTAGRITGRNNATGIVYMQDYSDTHNDGGVDTKVSAIKQMLDASTSRIAASKATIRWIFNFASAYSKTESLFGISISTSEGYRDNATHTHAAFLEYLDTHKPGPMGIVLMDYVGVDTSDGYEVKGLQLLQAIIDNNFKYLGEDATSLSSMSSESEINGLYSLAGFPLEHVQCGINIIRRADGNTRKVFVNR